MNTQLDFDDSFMAASNDTYGISFINLGEGYNGDYDEEDPNDVPLLRVDLLIKQGTDWDILVSFCTALPADTPYKRLEELASGWLEQMPGAIENRSLRELAAKWSWTDR